MTADQRKIFKILSKIIEEIDISEDLTSKEKMELLIFALLVERDGEGVDFDNKGYEIILDYHKYLKPTEEDEAQGIIPFEEGSFGSHEEWNDFLNGKDNKFKRIK